MQIFPLNEKIENINDQYWTLRAEEVCAKRCILLNRFISSFMFFCYYFYASILRLVFLQVPEEEKDLGPQDRLIHVYHFTKDTAQNQVVCVYD